MEKPLVSIVILNYNAGDFLENCISSIENSDYDNYEIILVDNNSNDQSHLKCKELFPKIRLIENSENLGYCEGNNVGIRHSRGEFVVILNPDTEVEPSWLSELITAYRKSGIGFYQPKICSLGEKNILQSTGNMIQLFGFGFARDKGLVDDNKYQKIETVGYPSGTCIFSSIEVFNKVGLFDPFIFLYHDDLDLGWKAAQRGIKSYFVPSSVVYHAESYALRWSAKKYFWLERNRRYCLLTHYSNDTYKKLWPYLIVVDLLVWFFYISRGYGGAKVKAELDLLKNRKEIAKKYDELEQKRIVDDIEIIKIFTNSIFVPKNVSGDIISKVFNFMLEWLSKKARKSLIR